MTLRVIEGGKKTQGDLSTLILGFEVIRHLTQMAEVCTWYVHEHGYDSNLLKFARRCSDCAEHIAQYFVEAPMERWPLKSAMRDLDWLIGNDPGLMPDPGAVSALKERISAHLENVLKI